MADNDLDLTGLSGLVASDDIAGVYYQVVKLADGTGDSATRIAAGGGLEANALRVTLASDSTGVLSVDDNGGSLTVDNAALAVVGGGVEATALRVTLASDSTGVLSIDDNGSTISVDDGAGSLTIDNAALSVTGGGVEATALRVTLANDSTGLLSVDDNGGSLTIDNSTLTSLASVINGSNQLDVNIAANALNSSTIIDDGDWTALTSYHTLIGGIYQSTPGSITDGDSGPLRMTVNGEAHVSLTTALPAGTNAIGKLAANSGVDIGDVDVTSIAAGTNAIGDVGITTRTSGGTSTYYNDGAVTLASIKASAGQIYSIEATNKSSTLYYLQLFNLATGSVTLGTTTPTNEYAIPHNSGNGAGFIRNITVPRAYGTAISYAITTTKGGATTGTANDVLLNVDYA